MNLKADPDQEEVMRDLEQSIGAKLADLVPSDDHVINLVDVSLILAKIGPVDTGSDEPSLLKEIPPGRRRLARIQEGQDLSLIHI